MIKHKRKQKFKGLIELVYLYNNGAYTNRSFLDHAVKNYSVTNLGKFVDELIVIGAIDKDKIYSLRTASKKY